MDLQINSRRELVREGAKRGAAIYGTVANDNYEKFKAGDQVVVKLSDGDKFGTFVSYGRNGVVTIEEQSRINGVLFKKKEQYDECQLRRV